MILLFCKSNAETKNLIELFLPFSGISGSFLDDSLNKNHLFDDYFVSFLHNDNAAMPFLLLFLVISLNLLILFTEEYETLLFKLQNVY